MKTIIKSTLFLAILLSIVACGKDNGMDIIDNDTDNNNDNSDLPFDVGFGAFGDEDALSKLKRCHRQKVVIFDCRLVLRMSICGDDLGHLARPVLPAVISSNALATASLLAS